MLSRPPAALPGLRPIPLIGASVALFRLFADPLATLPRLYREHGEIAALNRGDGSWVCAFGPRFNKQLLPRAASFEHATDMPIPLPPDSALERTSHSLTMVNGDEHRRLRRLMMPAFAKAALAGYRDDMVAIAGRHIGRWRPGQRVDLAAAFHGLTRDVMVRCLFGLEPGLGGRGRGDRGRGDDFGQLATSFLQLMISPAAMAVPINLPFMPYGRLLRVADELEQRLRELIARRRAGEGDGRDVLSLLLAAHDDEHGALSETELIANMGLLFVAGHETTAYGLSAAAMLLAQHPARQAELRAELDDALDGQAPSLDQLAELPLLDAVIKESLRILPPTYMTFIRRAIEPFELGGYALPAEARVVLSPLVTHHMPAVYPEPRQFRPARWLDAKPDPHAFVPFGVGPRQCLGARFAEQEMRLVLALLIQRFALRLRPGATIDLHARGITMGPRGAVEAELLGVDAQPRAAVEVGGQIREFVDW